MVRTQIYLSEEQKRTLERLSAERGVSMAKLIRDAVDRLLKEEESTNFEVALDKSFGIWRNRKDLQDSQRFLRPLREEWQRRDER